MPCIRHLTRQLCALGGYFMLRIDGRAPAPTNNTGPPIVSWRQTSMSPLRETLKEDNSSLLLNILGSHSSYKLTST